MDLPEGVRLLSPTDLSALRPRTAKVPAIRAAHHRMAELHAASLPADMIAELTGRSLTSVRNFPKVPANAELISQKLEEAAAELDLDPVREHTKTIIQSRTLAWQMIRDKLEEAIESGEEIPLRTLLSIAGDAADRTGFGRQTTQVNLNLDLGARLQKAREAVAKLREGKVVELAKSEFVRRV